MDRLFVKDINESNYKPAASFVGNRSFISTQFSNEMDYEDMKKSKIHNLPNYRKTDLGDNLPFVVVFQSIEIERLSEEIESNRIRIKDFQRQIFNAQNYEVQIRELTEKCFSLDSERSKYAQQTQKLNLICHQLYTELQQWKRKFSDIDLTLKDKFQAEKSRSDEFSQQIERWKSRYMAAQKSKVKELDDLRQLMESQRKSVVDREIREVTLRFQTQRGGLQNQIRKLREGLDFKNRELEQYREKCQKLEICLLESRRAQVIITELENKVVMLTHEISRLTELLKQKQDEVDGARRLQFELCQQLKEQQQWEFENKQLKNNLENRLREIQDWRVRCSKLDDQLTKISQVASANQELNTKVCIAGREIERLNGTLQSRVDEIENWKQKLARQEVQTNRYRNLETQVNNYQNKIVGLAKEIERLNGVLKTRLGDIQDWKSRCSKMEVTITNYSVVENNNRGLQVQVEEQGRHVNELKNKLGRCEIQVANLKMVEGRLLEADKRNSVLNGQVDRLNDFLRGKTQENDDLKIRHSKIESTLAQYRSIQTKFQRHEGTISDLTQQLERLNDSFRVKGDQCDRLLSKIRGLEEQISFLKTHQKSLQDNQRTINSLNQTVSDLKKGLQAEQDKSRGLQTRTRQQETTFVKIQQDKDRLGRDLKQKSVDLEEVRSRYGRLEQQIYQLKEVQATYRQAKNKLAMTVSELERSERITKDLGTQLDKERGLVQSLKAKVNMLGLEAQKLKSETGLKSKQYIQLKETFLALQKGSRDKDNEILVLNQKMANIQKQLAFMTSELQRFLSIIGQYQQKAQSLQQDIVKYQDYAKRIHILGAEIDRLVGENRGLEEDISKLRLRYANNIAAESRHQNQCLQFVMLFVEIESLRARLSEKESQADQIRKSVLEPIRNLR